MELLVNGEPRSFHGTASLAAVMEEIGRQNETGIAVAVNEKVIPALMWSQTELKESDKILIITATQGG